MEAQIFKSSTLWLKASSQDRQSKSVTRHKIRACFTKLSSLHPCRIPGWTPSPLELHKQISKRGAALPVCLSGPLCKQPSKRWRQKWNRKNACLNTASRQHKCKTWHVFSHPKTLSWTSKNQSLLLSNKNLANRKKPFLQRLLRKLKRRMKKKCLTPDLLI